MKRFLFLSLFASLTVAHADPQLTSWFTANSGQYARIYQTTAAQTAGTKSTTWTRGSGTQTNPAYADVNEVSYSANWIYIKTTGLPSHLMGPWYINAAKTTDFPNFPANTATSTTVMYRIPRTPTISTTKTLTGLGASGIMVNGVSMFDMRDAFSYVNTSATDATPQNLLTGDGVWNREAYANEAVTFDAALAHQAGKNYHYHAQPIALRYQLGDHVDYNATTNVYTESAAAVTMHSPILAWAADGLPVYGPYGYSDPTSASSGVRRMVSGFVLRDGTNGTTNLTSSGRATLPAWATRIQTATFKAGPAVSTTYALGHYIEDYDYLGDHSFTQTTGATVRDFDLNEQNVRFCVTPEYPSGTWAYFTPINAAGSPVYPFTTGRQYYATPTGGSATLSETVTTQFIGGANKPLTINPPAVSGTSVTLTWNSAEGGTYSVHASANQSTWTSKATGLVATGITSSSAYTALGTTGTEYGRVNRTALATYDTTGQTTATTAQTTTTSYALGGNASPTISTVAAQSTAQNTATSAIAFTVGDQETAVASLTVSGTSSNTTLVPNANIVFGGSGASRTVTITPATGQTGTSTITLNVNDGTTTTSTTFVLTVTAPNTAPTIATISNTPASPLSTDAVTVSANVTPSSGRTLSSVQLTYSTGISSTSTVFSETMGTSAAAWTTAANLGTDNAWTITPPVGQGGNTPPNPFSQTAAANHTATGSGHLFGLEINGGPPLNAIGDGSVSTTNNINATSTSGYVEFYLAAANQTATTGWNFQLSADGGTTWTTRLSESNTAHATHAYFTYTLAATERVSTLKIRFQFAGGGAGGTSKFSVDDIKVITTTGVAPVTVAMTGPASGGAYSVVIPAQASGTTVSYTITATDSTAAMTTSASNSYTVTTVAPVLAVTPSTALISSGAVGGAFSPSSATYTLTNSGTGTLAWTAAKTASWLTLSSASGSLTAGANTTVTATINTAANSLTAGSYSDTITFTNSTNASGNTTRAVSLAISSAIPAAPVLAALPTFSSGTSKTISWSAVTGATSYTLQIASSANFASNLLSSQTVTSPTGTFSTLTSGTLYYYRVLATNVLGSSAYSNTVFSTQDNVAPSVAITSPTSSTSTATSTITVTGTSSDALSGIASVTVNGVTATTSNSFATWTLTAPLGFGTNGLTAVATDNAGNTTTTAPINVTLSTAQTYNPLIIPEVMTGTTFNLNLHQTAKRFGNATFQNTADTTTYAYNNMLMWGPTLIMNKGDWVQMNVTNNLTDTTTTHWHGFHIPAIMDGGPHQTIPAGTTWSPSFQVANNAGTYWYHPHLHQFTQQQLTRGGGGMIIIRDPTESALNLPRTYGVDDFPLAMTSRRFTNNEFVTTNAAYGDYMLVNGTLSPQVTLPKQYVRLRLLNAEIERSYNLGFSDGRTFYQIATDGGLVAAPVALTRLVLGVGERSEILVDLSGDTVGATLDLQAFNSGQANDFPGAEPSTSGPVGSLLNNSTFTILHINIGAATANPITTRPTSLTTNTFWVDANVTNTRTVTITGGTGGTAFTFDNTTYTPTLFNQTLNLNAVEKWTVTNTSGFSHSFHIHDIEFNLISRTNGNNAGVKTYEQGWKDVFFISQNQTVTFIAKFDTFASNTNPFMYHCHFSNHEDDGLMGQFVVVNNTVEDLAVASFTRTGTNNNISLQFKATPGTTYTLQYSADMTTNSWTDVGSVTSNGTSASFTETDTTRLGQARGFYRVKIPVIP